MKSFRLCADKMNMHAPFFLCLILLSLTPIIFVGDRLAIGGDVLIPFNYTGMEKFLYPWTNLQNGTYYYINVLPLYGFYWLVELLGLNIYQASLLILVLLNIVAGFGIFKLIKLFHPKESNPFYFLPVSFYLLSPALLNGWHYLFIYSFIPWFLYLVFKIIKNKKVKIEDAIYFNIVLIFSSLDLPNPKYVFHLFFIAGIIFLFSIFLNLIKPQFFIRNARGILAAIGISLYIFLPLFYFALNYSSSDYGVNIKKGYKSTGQMMDYGSTTMDRMMRLHHNNLNLSQDAKKNYLSNSIITVLSFSFIFVFILNLFSINRSRISSAKYEWIFAVLIIIYLFFACGPNHTFGKFYEYIVTNFSLFAFLRTTAGAVFFLSAFYSVILMFFIGKMQKNRKKVIIFFFLIVLILGNPFLTGAFFKNNFSLINKNANENENGFKVPDEYFEIKESLDNKKIDGKILHVNNDLSYINTTWGYFGVLYNFLYKNNQIGMEYIISNFANHNVRFLFYDNSIMGIEERNDKIVDQGRTLKQESFLKFNVTEDDDFLQHFYTPEKIIIINENINDLTGIELENSWIVRSIVFLKHQNYLRNRMISDSDSNDLEQYNKSASNQILEFKRVNPIKYRVRIHKAGKVFPLVFSESFNNNWKVYVSDLSKNIFVQKTDIESYKILDGNSQDQANEDELVEFIDNGFVTDLGNGKEREIIHKKWNTNSQKEEVSYIEKYKIDFISKNFNGTIQNDNLPDGKIWDTWFQDPIVEDKHLIANGYANSWVIDVNEFCVESEKCIKNDDGTYDAELIVEFWPQRLFYFGLIISVTTLLGCIGFLIIFWVKKRKSDKIIRRFH